ARIRGVREELRLLSPLRRPRSGGGPGPVRHRKEEPGGTAGGGPRSQPGRRRRLPGVHGPPRVRRNPERGAGLRDGHRPDSPPRRRHRGVGPADLHPLPELTRPLAHARGNRGGDFARGPGRSARVPEEGGQIAAWSLPRSTSPAETTETFTTETRRHGGPSLTLRASVPPWCIGSGGNGVRVDQPLRSLLPPRPAAVTFPSFSCIHDTAATENRTVLPGEPAARRRSPMGVIFLTLFLDLAGF